MGKPIIRLWEQKGIGLIICYPSGVLYSNQAGGYACLQPEIEGVFVPLVDCVKGHKQEEHLRKHFTGPKWKGHCYDKIDGKTADFIDKILADSYITKRLKVDRSKLNKSFEAWIHINILSDERDSDLREFHGFESTNGIITWENSD